MQTKVDNNRVEAHDGLVDVFIQALIVEEHTERRVFAIDFRGDLLEMALLGLLGALDPGRVDVDLSILVAVVGPAEPIGLPSLAGEGPI